MKFSSRTHLHHWLFGLLAFCLIASLGVSTAHAADWTSFRGNSRNNAVTSARTPRIASEASLAWSYKLKDASEWSTYTGDPIIVGTTLYISVANELHLINKTSGELIKSITLPTTIDYSSRLTYGGGYIYVPLSGGSLAAISASTHTIAWSLPSIETTNAAGQPETYQSLSTPLYANGKLYVGATVADWDASYRGNFRCIDVSKETTDSASRIVWEHDNTAGGYYWSGAVNIGNAVIVAGDDGVVTSFNAANGAIIEEKPMGKNISVRSTVVAYGSQAVFTTTDGRLYRVAINSDGTFGKGAWSAKFAQSSTVTPAIYKNLAYVAGVNASGSTNKGVLCAIDLATMDVVRRIETANIIQSSPLISSAVSTNPYAYFTQNAEPGGIYGMSMKSGENALTFFEPEGDQANYCANSIIADAAGTLYYVNDSGYLFAVKTTVAPSNNAYIKSVSKSTGTWKSAWSQTRLAPKSTTLVIGSTKSSVKLTAYRSNAHAARYMRLSTGKYARTASMTVKLSRGQSKVVYIKCISESKKVSKTYKVIVTRR